MSTRRKFYKSDTVSLDTNGYGEIRLGPAGSTWEVERTTVFCDSGTIPQVRVYEGQIADENYMEGTYSGNNDTSDTKYTIEDGQYASCTFQGGDIGATARFRLAGWETT